MFASAVLIALVFAVSQVYAHGGVLSYQINGQHYQGYVIVPFCFVDYPYTAVTQFKVRSLQHPCRTDQYPARMGLLQPDHLPDRRVSRLQHQRGVPRLRPAVRDRPCRLQDNCVLEVSVHRPPYPTAHRVC